ncbi:MAG: hypothetical protein NXI04_18475 [Planctomycetaceae bacterium]|nr:hypothetical protein [Planctomycetaceae bacterium]
MSEESEDDPNADLTPNEVVTKYVPFARNVARHYCIQNRIDTESQLFEEVESDAFWGLVQSVLGDPDSNRATLEATSPFFEQQLWKSIENAINDGMRWRSPAIDSLKIRFTPEISDDQLISMDECPGDGDAEVILRELERICRGHLVDSRAIEVAKLVYQNDLHLGDAKDRRRIADALGIKRDFKKTLLQIMRSAGRVLIEKWGADSVVHMLQSHTETRRFVMQHQALTRSSKSSQEMAV